jgi:cardiolipin synthase A/B
MSHRTPAGVASTHAPPDPAPRWRLARCALLLALLGGASACRSVLPQDKPAAATVSAAPAPITVHGAQGPVGGGAKAATIAGLAAEGRADLALHHLKVLADDGAVDLVRGNRVKLLVDGPATFAAMKAAIAGARTRVLLQSYIIEDRGIAADIAKLLIERAAQGVSVALLYDALGSIGTDEAFFERLRAGGVAVCAFNPVNPVKRLGYWGINRRDHRKLLVVDNERAFTGGINISRVYRSSSFTGRARARQAADGAGLDDGWRDTQIELAGPVVPVLAREFAGAWHGQGCQGALAEAPPPRVAQPGQRVVKVIASDPRDESNRIYFSLLNAVAASQRSVHLTMAYFAPGEAFVQALCDAARRGVAVEMVLPGKSDFPLVLHAGRSYYKQLLDAGVRIHEMEHALMHAKTAVIDGVFSTVGSSNLDWRSLVDNHELNVIVLGDDFGAEMEAMFARDREASQPIDARTWRERPMSRRLMEQLGRMAERWL